MPLRLSPRLRAARFGLCALLLTAALSQPIHAQTADPASQPAIGDDGTLSLLAVESGVAEIGRLQTVFTDYLKERLPVAIDTPSLPAGRVHVAMRQPLQVCAVGLIRLPQVEAAYHWVMPIIHSRIVRYGSETISSTLTDGRYGVMLGTTLEQYARHAGEDVIAIAERESIFEMLKRGRLRGVIDVDIVVDFRLAADPDLALTEEAVLAKVYGWLACSRAVPAPTRDRIVAIVRNGLHDGSLYERLPNPEIRRYIPVHLID
ncbi:MAG: hypothetical protein JJ878_13065 [Alphaproteobacteria bacterium]|nr:hypothetical protein [Alphaproteobacteria bacterium]MBO6863563.1 hypothetical protein [Alphaproteobacteria bacterium]